MADDEDEDGLGSGDGGGGGDEDEDDVPLLLASDQPGADITMPDFNSPTPGSAGDSRDQWRATTCNVNAVFVVNFDPVSGNMIEWCDPPDAQLQGVEFKAMVSGSHTIVQDFVYFKHKENFGVACFEKMSVASELERGARMKSVGILASSHAALYQHLPFLREQVNSQLERQGHYGELKTFLSEHCFNPESNLTPGAEAAHSRNIFQHFLNYFGPQIFSLWRAMLLHKRVLFVSSPPVGAVCERLYACCCMAAADVRQNLHINPLFFVGLNDIGFLESEFTYVACTTEKVLENKTQLYDVFVNDRNVVTHLTNLQPLLCVNSTDVQRLLLLRQEILIGSKNRTYEDIFTDFFTTLTKKLFRLLDFGVNTVDGSISDQHLKSAGFSAATDSNFVANMARVHGYDVRVATDKGPIICCPNIC